MADAKDTGKNADKDVAAGTPVAEESSLLSDLVAASANLSPSEIPTVAEVPAVVGALVHFLQHDDLPEPLAERFPTEE